METDVIDGYLIRGEIEYQSIGEGMWVINDDVEHIDNIVVTQADPIVLFRVKLMDLPADEAAKASLCEKLLRLNASAMVAGAYGVDGNSVIVSETLQSESLDFNEFQAAIDGLTMAITGHYDELKKFHHSA